MTVRTRHTREDNPQVVSILEDVLEQARRGEVHSVAIAYLTPDDDAMALSMQPGRSNTMLGVLEILHARVQEGDEWL